MRPELEQAIQMGAKCDECPLAVGGRTTYGSGPLDADLAIVGEAPGVQEAREGVPFIGPSGKLLDRVLKVHKITRKEVRLTNACLCRPIDGKTPPKSAIEACRPRLLNELQRQTDASPAVARTIVAMGNSAALATLGVEGILRLRVGPGSRSPYPELEGARVIPTVHPAACLRSGDMFPFLITDIGKIEGGVANAFVEPDYRVFDDPVDAIRVLGELKARAGVLVVDIEVDIEKDTGFDHPDRYGLLCVGLGHAPGKAVIIGEVALRDEAVRSALADTLRASRLVAQNGKFDLAGLFPTCGALELWFDTMLASYALDERAGVHGLKFMAQELLGYPNYEKELDGYNAKALGYGVIPRPVLYKYNAYDVTSTYSLYVLFVERLERQGLRELHDFLVAASNELMFVELNGIAVDRTYIGELTKEAESVLEGIRQRIDDILTEVAFTQKDARGRTKPFNPNSPVQVKLVLNKLKAYVSSTDADHLQAILDQCKKMNRQNGPLYRFVDELMHHRKEAKLYGTYIKGTSKRLYRGRVYPTFLLHGTTTGRLSCRNPNLQNVPRGSRIKNLFVPAKPGNVFVQADYAQAELRVLAWLAQESYFRDILNDPTRDLFDELTPRLYPKLPSKAEVNSTKAGQEHWKDIRVRVKAFVYGLSYGRTPEGLAMEYGMSVMEARNMYALFFSTIPNVVEYQKNLLAQVKRGEDLVTPFGRHRRFWLITVNNWDDIQNQALAFLPQSTSSDVCLRAMVAIRRELRGTGAFIRNIVHDSILVDCPPDMARDIGIVLDRHMVASGEELVSGYVDFKTDVKIGNRWGEV